MKPFLLDFQRDALEVKWEKNEFNPEEELNTFPMQFLTIFFWRLITIENMFVLIQNSNKWSITSNFLTRSTDSIRK